MQRLSKPVRPADLGVIGKDHTSARFADAGAEMATFNYCKESGTTDGLPWVIEIAFAWADRVTGRRLITGVNFSPGITNPFRSLGTYSESLDAVLANQWARRDDPVIVLVHLSCPLLSFTDRGKSALALGSSMDDSFDHDEDELEEDEVEA
jgi:hypothetical protein